ncbi:MAG TPA: hypothetical protein VHW44_13505 [Pseudonocardiaceae bacterium]|jgi:hypothetical protein|nr:hypothetical protein [Pseudonocardiaceae bacterium]
MHTAVRRRFGPHVRQSIRRSLSIGTALLLPIGMLITFGLPAAAATPAAAPAAAPATAGSATISPAARAAALPAGWQTSTDRAVTTDGDATGLHVLVADEKDGYTWRTAATLTEPGTDTDQWIGQSCVTASGLRAVVVYAPRQMVNTDTGFHLGGLAAIVDLTTGAVTKLPMPVSLAYYDPGCGADERAVLTSADDSGSSYVTDLTVVDTTTGKILSTMTTPGQVTSAVPYGTGIAAASLSGLVSMDYHGTVSHLTDLPSAPFRLSADSDGGLGYEVMGKTDTQVRRFAAGQDSALVTAPNDQLQLDPVGGRVFVQGDQAGQQVGAAKLPKSWAAVNVAPTAQLSTAGTLAVTSSTNRDEAAGRADLTPSPDTAEPISITAQVMPTHSAQSFVVAPDPMQVGQGSAESPALGTPAAPANQPNVGAAQQPAVTPNVTDPSTQTIDPDRTCAIPRNDPTIESLQPTAQMGEWAADLAVQNSLTLTRPAGWNGSALPAYTPQGMFPNHALAGGGSVPAQVLLGVMSQESNMWQASNHVVDGESGNFEQGGFYGNDGDITTVRFDQSDCGYGAAQVTTGMTLADTTTYTANQKLAITVDYAANIAAGLEILEDKWNQLFGLGMTVNGGDPQYIENWWYALWAYNSGWHAQGAAGTPYGLGWANNPANEDFVPDRKGFLDASYDDAKTPNHWSYPERVMGWAKHALLRLNYVSGVYVPAFKPGHWPTVQTGVPTTPPYWVIGDPVVPAFFTFCTSTNQCDPTKIRKPGGFPTDPGSNCQRDDLECWWHTSVTWANCASFCGTQVLSYPPGAAEPLPTQTLYHPDCNGGELPAGALVIDSTPASVHTNTSCTRVGADSGTLSFKFNSATNALGKTVYPSKVDFHQIDDGFNNHLWFAHTWIDTVGNDREGVTGTWTLNKPLTQWARVMVYVPNHAAQDHQAWYTINLGNGQSERRAVVEDGSSNSWRDLGVFQFAGTPSVSLSNFTSSSFPANEQGEQDTDWNSVAFQPLSQKPANIIVAMGDSYSSGEGATSPTTWDYYPESDHDGADWNRDGCHRSTNAWSRQADAYPNETTSIGALEDRWDPSIGYNMIACSGARAYNMLPTSVPGGSPPTDAQGRTGAGQYLEAPQLDQGYLDANTTLVTLSVGGNDARFTDIIKACLEQHVVGIDCPDVELPGDSAVLNTTETPIIDNVVAPSALTVLQQIHRLAPNAQIKLMGYPKLIESGITTCNDEFGPTTITWFDFIAGYLDSALSNDAQDAFQAGIPVEFLDPEATFQGKAACGTPEDINAIVLRFSAGDDPTQVASQQSFHPKPAGAALYAGILTLDLKTGI